MPIEALDCSKHDRARFKCGTPIVDEYLQRVARQAGDRFVSQTFVLVEPLPRTEPCEIIGYYTLVQHAYRDGEMDPVTAKALKVKNLGVIPTVLLGQLGVSIRHQRRGVGRALLRDALRRSLYVSLTIGAVAVVTDPVDESAAEFYARHGFKPLGTGPRMLIPTIVLARYNSDIAESFRTQPEAVPIMFGAQDYKA